MKRAERTGDTLGPLRPRRDEAGEAAARDAEGNLATATASFRLDHAVPAEVPKLRRSFLFAVAIATSLAGHVAPIVYLTWQAPSHVVGAGGVDLEAVSVDLVSSSALESTNSTLMLGASAASQPLDTSSGIDAPVQQVEIAATAPPPVREPATLFPIVQPDPTPTTDPDLIVQEVVKPEDKKPIEPEVIVAPQPDAETGKDEGQAASQPAIVAGGSTSQAHVETGDGEGAAGASAGDLARYAIELRLALGKVRPRHSGSRGRVQVTFQLGVEGELQRVDVSRSSGRSDLDEAAVGALRRAAFPRPPAGTSEKQRTFVVPFDFK